ncbi:MFS transporter [Isoptericola sp. b441]|uniref:MFS transporter n=1 Tax=Actinotalea lenta TaxID=3064654 RepID=A0ABT9D8Y5_9CELL|nr:MULTISPECIES: MFS transporter [unclassified Isoptericola]MDO8105761.1 MFS transporter [Isoptericola sp. b441]MDO8122466.1 MFS transporter [Isoptericola sp. b490]
MHRPARLPARLLDLRHRPRRTDLRRAVRGDRIPRQAPVRRPPVRRPLGGRPGDAPDALVARAHLFGLYLLLGLTVSTWLARLPTVRESLHLSTGELGTVLLVGSLGSLTMVLGAGALATRWGSRRSMVVAAWTYSVAAVLLGVGPEVGSVVVLGAGVVAMSVSFALGNVPLNVQSVAIERRMGRTVVPQFHAGFSIGSVLGSGLGALAAWGRVPLVVQFSAVAVVALVWRLRSIPGAVLPMAPQETRAVVTPGGSMREALRAWRDPRTLVLGVLVMAGGLSEGTANNWLAIGVVDGFRAREAVGALVFATFVASMTAARVSGTRLIDRFGRAPVMLASTSTALAGLVGFALSPTLPVAVLGAVAWGLGAGLVVPIGMAAVTGDGVGAAGRVAVASAFASTANLIAPPAIGLAAEAAGVRHAVLLVGGVMIVGVLLSRRVADDRASAVAPSGAPAAVPALEAVDLPVLEAVDLPAAAVTPAVRPEVAAP